MQPVAFSANIDTRFINMQKLGSYQLQFENFLEQF